MEINIDSLFPFEKALSETKEVFDLVDKKWQDCSFKGQ